MNLWFVVKARAVWLFGMALALAGLAAVLYAAALPFVPELDPRSSLPTVEFGSWTLKLVHVSALAGALGAIVGGTGMLLAYRQTLLLQLARRSAEDRRRRVKQYRADELTDGRIEPTFTSERAGEKDRRAA